MAAHPRKKITISIVLPFLVFILFFSIMIWQKYRSSHEVPVTPPQPHAVGNRSILLFFAAEGTRLSREARDVDACEVEEECLKSVLDELLNGPIGELEEVVPDGTVIDAVHIEGNQATIEVNKTFSDAMVSGSSAEMLAVYSIVDTVATNFPHIQKVKINVEGNKAALLHHLDLSEPLSPDYSLEQLPAHENQKGPAGPTTRKGAVQ